MSDPKPLAFYLPLLIDIVAAGATDRQRRLPPFSKVVISEERNGERLDSWLPAPQFEARFRQILDFTNRSWVNLHCERVEEDQFCVVVEYLTTATGCRRTWASDKISVNLSGPELHWLEGLPAADTA